MREELLQGGEYVMLNGLEGRGSRVEVVGGPWTWCQPGKEEVRSCLDLVVISASLLPFIKRMVIDSIREFTPRRLVRRKEGVVSVYTDHYAVEVVVAGLPGAPDREGRVARPANWNLGKPGGWERYEELSVEAARKIEEVLETEALNSEEIMKKVETIETKLKFKAFGKTKPKTEKKLAQNGTKEEEELLKEQAKQIEEEILKVKEDRKGKVGRVYAMRKKVNGDGKEAQEPVAIRDPETGDLVVAAEEIKRVTLKYCEGNLTKKDELIKKEVEMKEMCHKIRMDEKDDDDDCVIEKKDFEEIMRKFSSKPTKAYDFILKASAEFKEAIFSLCKRFLEREEIPRRMKKTTLQMIWKKKGLQEVLSNNRFIHLKDYMARTCEAMVVGKMKERIFNSTTIYQIGGQAGHFIEEHLFSIKSLMGMMVEQGRGIILTLVDIVAFFDRENILDVMDVLETRGVSKKAARLWYRVFFFTGPP